MKEARRIEFSFEVVRIVVALAVAYLGTLICIYFLSEEPLEAIYTFAVGPFTTKRRFGQMMAKYIPLLMTGISMCLIYACNRFNMIAEGCYIMGGCLYSVVAIVLVPETIRSGIAIAIGLCVGAAAGILAGLAPTLLREKLGVNEVVTSVMFNYAFLYMGRFLIKHFTLDPTLSYLASLPIPANSKLTSVVSGTLFHKGIFIAVVVVVIVCVLYFRTAFGYHVKISGSNEHFSRTIGINITGSLIAAQLLASAIAGMGGAIDMMGVYDRYLWELTPGVGTDGLLVAVLARKNPLLVPVAAFLLAYMRAGAAILNYSTEIPLEMVQVMQGIIILMIAAEEFLGPLKKRMVLNLANKREKRKEVMG